MLSSDDVEELKKTSCRNRRIETIEKEIEFAEERKEKINNFIENGNGDNANIAYVQIDSMPKYELTFLKRNINFDRNNNK